jgi:16S rRNA (guanine1207-N2)-methyltransferase
VKRDRGPGAGGRAAGADDSRPSVTASWRDITLGGQSISIPDDPLCIDSAADPANRLLAEHAALRPGYRVLLLGAGCGLLASWAATRVAPGQLTLSDIHSAALERAAATLRRNHHTQFELLPAEKLGELAPELFDAALVDIAFQSSSKALVAALRAAGNAIRPGGRLYIAGAKAQGIGAVKARAAEMFGAAGTLGYRKGVHVIAATRPAVWGAPSAALKVAAKSENNVQPDTPTHGDITLRGHTFRLALRDGVFARGGMDEGTRMLLEAIQVRPDDHALDLGCGGGIVGMLLARLAPIGHVYLADSDTAAVALARDNLRANGIANATVYAGDGLSAVPGERFDLIASNPPFHLGRRQTTAIARDFIAGAAQALRPGGRFYIVANRFLPYERAISAAFGNVLEVAGDNRYKVLLATRASDEDRGSRIEDRR